MKTWRFPRLRLALRRLLLALVTLLAWPHREASAHELTPGVLALKERSPAQFELRWTAPLPRLEDLVIRLPSPCRVNHSSVFDAVAPGAELPHVLDCGSAGLSGEITFDTKNTSPGRISVNVEWLDGTQVYRLSTGMPPAVDLGRIGANQGSFDIFGQYLGLGIEHIWLGVDHLLFVLGLLLLVSDRRSLLWTITAFTVAHSMTLALASLGLVRVPTGPVEICIALSVLLLAVEAARQANTLTRRRPWLLAFSFGLLHGLGFASALAQVGLPKQASLVSLVGFNSGVELGQLAVVGFVVLGERLLVARPRLRVEIASVATWTLGVSSVFWLFERVRSWLGGYGLLG